MWDSDLEFLSRDFEAKTVECWHEVLAKLGPVLLLYQCLHFEHLLLFDYSLINVVH